MLIRLSLASRGCGKGSRGGEEVASHGVQGREEEDLVREGKEVEESEGGDSALHHPHEVRRLEEATSEELASNVQVVGDVEWKGQATQ